MEATQRWLNAVNRIELNADERRVDEVGTHSHREASADTASAAGCARVASTMFRWAERCVWAPSQPS